MKVTKAAINININSIEKFWEREYCVFTISSYELSINKLLKYGGIFFDYAIYVFKSQKLSHYRDPSVQNKINQIFSEKMIKSEKFREKLLNNYIKSGEFLEKAFNYIENNKKISSSFIKRYCKTFGDLSAGTLLIQRCPDYLIGKTEYLELADRLIKLRKRFEYIFGGTYEKHLDIMLKTISKERNLNDFKDLKYLNVFELMKYNEKGILPRNLSDRKKMTIILIFPKKKERFLLISGEKAQNFFKKIKKIEEEIKMKKISTDGSMVLKGLSVSSGNIRGIVQVIKDFKNLSKFKKEGILVVPSTLPKYENYYHEASAIVADEGGMLSHIAIFCREFKKIGIAGTKIATQVLKDGDLVEVDADNGVVRILKND